MIITTNRHRGLLVFSALIIAAIAICLAVSIVQYNKAVAEIENTVTYGGCEEIYTFYYLRHGEYPISHNEAVRDALRLDANAILPDIYDKKDPLSHSGNSLQYFPLYDRLTKKRVSFFILSSGIDGKIDTAINTQDSLFFDTWWNNVAVYNYSQTILASHFSSIKKRVSTLPQKCGYCYNDIKATYMVPYSIVDKFWGHKDYIVQFGSNFLDVDNGM